MLRLVVVTAAVALVVAVGAMVVSTRDRADDTLARRDADTAATAASHLAEELGQRPTAEQLAEYEPSLEYESLDPGEEVAVQGKVYVRVRGEVAELAARSGDTCFWVQEVDGAVRKAKGSCDATPDQLQFRADW